jgi:hypothetical protein
MLPSGYQAEKMAQRCAAKVSSLLAIGIAMTQLPNSDHIKKVE